MTQYAELEIGLHRRDSESYGVELRFSHPDGDADIRPTQYGASVARFDIATLHQLVLEPDEYGRLLGSGLLYEEGVRMAVAQAQSVAQSLDAPLRLRLFIGPTASELHGLRWESLHLPGTEGPLLAGESIVFSRYLSSQDWRPVHLRPKESLRALIVIANPSDISSYAPEGEPLSAIDAPGELARVRKALGAVEISDLATKGQATLERVIANLRHGYDILYLVCHGLFVRGEPWLMLEDADGNSARVAGRELAERMRELRQRPQLVVLASCRSAGDGQNLRGQAHSALAALGPQLAEAGIPAVVAMQGDVSQETVTAFMPTFFDELMKDGQIDRAMAVARGAVRRRFDWWMPVLFMRFKSGRIWYTPGFGDERWGQEKWPALLMNIKRGRCTPVLGPGLTESLLGSRLDLAQRWAETYHFPMAPHDREDLPQVAQYLAVNEGRMFPRDELGDYLRQELLQRYGADLPTTLAQSSLSELIAAAGADLRAKNSADPHRVLAALSLPIYITTDPSTLLVDALREAGRTPQVEPCRWNEYLEQLPSIYDDEPDYRPSAERPLVFQLFGSLDEPESLVLTEDDYFDYLIGVTGNKALIPAVVRRALTDTALLFLGFRMDEWDFRVLFRSIMSQEGRGRRRGYAHVSAQIDPDGSRILEPDGARRYLASYFQDADISIYWGSAEDFLRELHDMLPRRLPLEKQAEKG
jgi:hypothetical protein